MEDDWVPSESEGEDALPRQEGQTAETKQAQHEGTRAQAVIAAGPPLPPPEEGPPPKGKGKRQATVPVGGPSPKGRRRPRQLLRTPSDSQPRSLSVEPLLCLWGRPLKAPVAIHPVRRCAEGKSWIVLGEHLTWFRRACAPAGDTHYDHGFQSAINDLRSKLRDLLIKARETSKVEQSQQAMRAELGLEEEKAPDNASVGCRTSARQDGQQPCVKVTLNATVITMQSSVRPLMIECTREAVLCLIGFCQEHCRAGRATLKKEQNKTGALSFQMPQDACPSILGKITWHPSVNAWAVHWKNKANKSQTTRVTVSAVSVGFAELRRARYVQALKMWNELDCSKRERINIEDPASGP